MARHVHCLFIASLLLYGCLSTARVSGQESNLDKISKIIQELNVSQPFNEKLLKLYEISKPFFVERTPEEAMARVAGVFGAGAAIACYLIEEVFVCTNFGVVGKTRLDAILEAGKFVERALASLPPGDKTETEFCTVKWTNCHTQEINVGMCGAAFAICLVNRIQDTQPRAPYRIDP